MSAAHDLLMCLQQSTGSSILPGTYLPPLVDSILAAIEASGDYIRRDRRLSDAALEAAAEAWKSKQQSGTYFKLFWQDGQNQENWVAACRNGVAAAISAAESVLDLTASRSRCDKPSIWHPCE